MGKFGSIYWKSLFGKTTPDDFGNIYYGLTLGGAFTLRVEADGGTVESIECIII